MDTPRSRYTVLPFVVAFLQALADLPATTVVRVCQLGMGFEHEQPWRQRGARTMAAVRSVLSRLSARLLEGPPSGRQHGPALAALAALTVMAFWHPEAMLAAPVVFGVLTEGTHAGEFLLGERPELGSPSRENITVLSGQNLTAGAVVGRVNKGVGRVSVPTVVGTGNGTVNTVFAGPEVEVGSYVLTCTAAATHGGTWGLVTPSGKALPALTMTPGAGGSTTYRSRHLNFTIVDGSTDFIVGDAFTFVVDTTAPLAVGTGNGTISALSLGRDAKPGNYRFEIIAAITNGGEFKLIGPDGDVVETGFIVAGAGGTFVGTNKNQLNFTVTEGSTDFALGDAFNVAVFNQLNGGKVVAWDPTVFDGRDDAAGVLYAAVDASTGDTPGVLIARDATVIKASLQWGASIAAATKESAYRDLAARGIIAR